MKTKTLLPLLLVGAITASCAIIRPGEVGLKQKYGKLSSDIKTQGAVFYNPLTSKVIKTSIQTNNLELSLSLPSKEGLSITSQNIYSLSFRPK